MNTKYTPDEPTSTRLRWLIGIMLVLAIPVMLIWWPGCRQYPAVTSKESLELMKLVYAACNTKDPARLGRAEQQLATLDRDGKLSPAEKASFDQIIGLAKKGEWPDAEKAALKFAQDQVGQGH